MQLTQIQVTTLKTHLLLNTNKIQVQSDPAIAINICPGINGDPTYQAAIASWYNSQAQTTDNQPFSTLTAWNPGVTGRQLQTAIKWQIQPSGADQPTIANLWNAWFALTQASAADLDKPCLDLTDSQVQKGVYTIWGDSIGTSAFAIGKTTCGQKKATRFELTMAGSGSNGVFTQGIAVNASPGGAFVAAIIIPVDANGKLIYSQINPQTGQLMFGQQVNALDIANALLNG